MGWYQSTGLVQRWALGAFKPEGECLENQCHIHCMLIVWMARENRSLVLVVESELFVSLGKDALIVVIVNLVKLFKLLCHTALHF